MAAAELQVAEDELAEQLQQHSEALQGVREALQADPGNVELVQVKFATNTFAALKLAARHHGSQAPQRHIHWLQQVETTNEIVTDGWQISASCAG
jgi:hypothetical protein